LFTSPNSFLEIVPAIEHWDLAHQEQELQSNLVGPDYSVNMAGKQDFVIRIRVISLGRQKTYKRHAIVRHCRGVGSGRRRMGL